MSKRKYESLKKSINFLKAERREHHLKIKALQEILGTLDNTLNDLVRINRLRWPDPEASKYAEPGFPDIVTGIEPRPTPFASRNARENTLGDEPDPTLTREYRPGEKAAYEKGYTNGWDARERTRGGDWPKETVILPKDTTGDGLSEKGRRARAEFIQFMEGWKTGEPVRLPDGSGFFTASFPLPKDHWLYEKDAEGFQPRMPKHLKWEKKHDNENIRHSLSAALKVAIRGATCGGTDEDFDPDALLLNFFNALFGPSEETTCHPINSDTEPSPASEYCGDATGQSTATRPPAERKSSEPSASPEQGQNPSRGE